VKLITSITTLYFSSTGRHKETANW